MKTVSYTSQWTAAARAVETDRNDALFKDPLAKYLAEPKGFELLKTYDGGGLQDFVAIRTKYIDTAIESLVMMGNIRQVVIVAAGMDTRAYRLHWPWDTVLYEIDYDALHYEKQKRLDKLGVNTLVDRRVVMADLSTSWLPELYNAGFDTQQPTLWIAEAILFFLHEQEVATLLTTLASISTPGSFLITDVLNAEILKSISTQNFLNSLRANNIPWLFGINNPEEYFAKFNWEVFDIKEPGQDGAGLGRWPYAVIPRETLHVPRNWLIQAQIRNL